MAAPYFFSRLPRIWSSDLPLCTAEAMSCFIGTFAVHSGWEHSDKISRHPQLQNTFVVSEWRRDASSPADNRRVVSAITARNIRRSKFTPDIVSQLTGDRGGKKENNFGWDYASRCGPRAPFIDGIC